MCQSVNLKPVSIVNAEVDMKSVDLSEAGCFNKRHSAQDDLLLREVSV